MNVNKINNYSVSYKGAFNKAPKFIISKEMKEAGINTVKKALKVYDTASAELTSNVWDAIDTVKIGNKIIEVDQSLYLKILGSLRNSGHVHNGELTAEGQK